MDEKTKNQLSFAFILIMLILVISIFVSGIKPSEIKSSCLEQLAEIYCAEKGMDLNTGFNSIMDDVSYNKADGFSCANSSNRRMEQNSGERYLFLEEEKEYCKQECMKQVFGLAKVHC